MEDELYKVPSRQSSSLESSGIYQRYANTRIIDVPFSDLTTLMRLFIDKAAINMGKDSFDKKEDTINAVCEFLFKTFRDVPIYYVGSAIYKGSLGTYGPGRLVPATVFKWMNEVNQEFRRRQAHEELMSDDNSPAMNLHKLPVGRAIHKKIDWLKGGRITESDYDKIPLKEVAERLAEGLDVVPELWGVKSKKQKDDNF